MKIITKTEQIERFNSSFDILSSDYDIKGHVKYLREKNKRREIYLFFDNESKVLSWNWKLYKI